MQVWRMMLGAGLGALALAGAVAQAQTAKPAEEITVNGARQRMSGWREAQTNHVVILSDGKQDELLRIARNVERLHFLLSGLFGQPQQMDEKQRLQITLIGNVAKFEELDLRNRRWQQGPFADAFRITRYYDPRDDGAVMASTSVDQRVIIERTPVSAERVRGVIGGLAGVPTGGPGSDMQQATQIAVQSALVGDFAASGLKDANDMGATFGENAIPMSAESMIYAGYAQHYLLTNFPAAYPRWYLDGFGQVFATFATKGETIMEFGRAPTGATKVLEAFGGFPVGDVLSDKYLTLSTAKTAWTPVHAWLLTHFLFFSDTRRPQLRQYLAARAKGQNGEAAFGDIKALTKELRVYFAARKPYEQITYNPAIIDQPTVRQLTEGEAAFITGRLEMGGRLALPAQPPVGSDAKVVAKAEKAMALAIKERDAWAERLRREAGKWGNDVHAQALLAEAECRLGNSAPCLAAANAVLRIAPQDLRGLVWKGSALTQLAGAASGAEKARLLAEGRGAIAAANRRDPANVGALLAYYRSFALGGEAPTNNAIDALQGAVAVVPSAPANRLALGQALAARGQGDVARPIVVPVALGPYETPEQGAARQVLAQIDGAAAVSK